LYFGACILVFGIILSGRASPYETTPKWHCFLLIKLAAFQASGWAEI